MNARPWKPPPSSCRIARIPPPIGTCVAQLAQDDAKRAEREATRRAKRTAQGRKWGA